MTKHQVEIPDVKIRKNDRENQYSAIYSQAISWCNSFSSVEHLLTMF